MDLEKALSRAALLASAAGLLVVAYAVVSDSIPATSRGYTEVYFENPGAIPRVMIVGERYLIPFVVSSREKEVTHYNYTATFSGVEIAGGGFTLAPGEKKLLTLELIPESASWRLSSNRSSRGVERFPGEEILIKEDRKGGIQVSPAKFNRSELEEKGLLLLPLNRTGLYSAESEYQGRSRSTLSITREEVYMEYSWIGGYNFTWNNSLRLLELAAGASSPVWLAVNKTRGELKRSLVYSNVPLDFSTGLPGEIYLLPGEGRYLFSYSSANKTAGRVEYVEKNAVIAVDREGISMEKVLVEKTYVLEKTKLSILLRGDGKSYEIHFWSYVRD